MNTADHSPAVHTPAPWFALWANPIAQRCRRARLRPKHLLTYGVVGLCVITFVFLTAYLSAVQRFEATPQIAARATLIPMLVLQGILLMGVGTAALASGIARERDRDLLDYQRMTPMSPTAKILGYLLGLPSREYLLFALTVPFVAFAVVVAELPLWKIAKYYAVFFSSVWVYHLTGLCAGIVSKKPWQASAISLGSVVGLYLVLPQLSFAGLSFFDFLTVRPTFYSLIAEELNQYQNSWNGQGHANAWIRQYGDVPFFHTAVNPTVFSLAVQAFMLVTLFTVIHRKWIDPHQHPFSKRQSLAFLAGIVLVLVGTLWPTLADEDTLYQLQRRLTAETGPQVMGWLLGLYLLVATATTLLVIHLITPRKHTAQQGFRRALRLGHTTVPAAWDAAPALRWVIALLLLAVAGYAALVAVALPNPALFEPDQPTPWLWLAAPVAILLPSCLFVHALCERLAVRAMLLTLFALWVLPVMAAIIVGIAANNVDHVEVLTLWIASPSPLIPGTLALLTLIQETGTPMREWQAVIQPPLRDHVPHLILAHVALYTVLALLTQTNRRQWIQRWRTREQNQPQATANPTNQPTTQPVPGSDVPGNANPETSKQPTG